MGIQSLRLLARPASAVASGPSASGAPALPARRDSTGWSAGGWRARGRSVSMMYGTGGALVALSLLWKSPPAVYRPGVLAVALIAMAVPFGVLALGRRYTMALSHVSTAFGSLLIGLIVYWGAGTYLSIVYGIFLVWVAQYSAMFYSRWASLLHIWFGLSLDAVALVTLPASQGNRLMTWLIIAGSCHVMVIAYSFVDRMSARFRGLVEHSGGVVAIVDLQLRFRYVAGPLERLSGHERSRLLGTSLLEWTHPDDAAHPLRAVQAALANGAEAVTFESRMLRADGVWAHTESSVENALGDRSIAGLVFTIRDVTERKTLEDQLTHQAFHDTLTNLPNRALFMNRVEHALARAGRSTRAVGVLMIDLDDFKSVNDTLGHDAGDALLREVAVRLVAGTRPADTVCRLGGDEFAVLLEDLQQDNETLEVARRLLQTLQAPALVKGVELFPSASIGVAVADTGLEDAAGMIRDADTAMYQAKRGGKGRAESFDVGMHDRLVRRVQLKADLHRALEGNEFRVVYQPTVVLESGEIHGMEALIRWEHPSLGLVSPLEFIPVAEETGLIVPIGAWVLRQACNQAAAWQRQAPASGELLINVNVSGRQLEHEGLLDDVTHALRESGLEPSRLVLEITESVLLQDLEPTVKRLHELRGLGVRVAIDDFGTGYSSLSYLNRLPIDLIKIDKSFVDRLHVPQELALVETIVKFGRILGVETLAEGVEKPEQAAQLHQIRCEYGQGYLFARPLDVAAVTSLLTTQS